MVPRGQADRGWRRAAPIGIVLLLAAAQGFAMGQAATHEDSSVEQAARAAMIDQQIRARGITEPAVLAAMQAVPRHLFVAARARGEAYEDHPLPIGFGQTISQPFVVALMTSLLHLSPDARVLEIGTGSGYQAAVLSHLASRVYSMEIVPGLAEHARRTLAELGYRNVEVRLGDGFRGWPEQAPFDAIVLTAAPQAIPPPLLGQLKTGGRMVVPVGDEVQTLLVLTKRPDGGYDQSAVAPVRFVPMTGEAQQPPH
jgi:protein-L-isoaspartate(D-aspartate) O-methyltransferase